MKSRSAVSISSMEDILHMPDWLHSANTRKKRESKLRIGFHRQRVEGLHHDSLFHYLCLLNMVITPWEVECSSSVTNCGDIFDVNTALPSTHVMLPYAQRSICCSSKNRDQIDLVRIPQVFFFSIDGSPLLIFTGEIERKDGSRLLPQWEKKREACFFAPCFQQSNALFFGSSCDWVTRIWGELYYTIYIFYYLSFFALVPCLCLSCRVLSFFLSALAVDRLEKWRRFHMHTPVSLVLRLTDA